MRLQISTINLDKRNLHKKINLLDLISLLFAILFIYAAASKIVDYDLFKAQIGKSPLITKHANWISWAVPGIEIITALTLFIPRLQLFSLYACYAIMFTFTIYIAFLLLFSPYVPCSCGGILNNMGWTGHIIFNICFTAMSIFGIYAYNKQNN